MSSKTIITALACCLLLCCNAAFAQSMPKSTIVSQALRNGNLKLTVADGRISIPTDRFNTNGSLITPKSRRSSSSGRRESLQLRLVNGQPQLAYELSTSKDKLTLGISRGNRILFKRVLTEEGKKAAKRPLEFEFVQSPDAPLRLTLTAADDEKQVFTSESLWHMLLEHPEPFQQHVLPLLEILRPNWKLMETAAEAEKRLLEMAAGRLPDHDRWEAMLVQLSDDSFARREEADRALRAGGDSALRFLRELEFRALDAEQQSRVRRIVRSMSAKKTDDNLDEIASMLVGDSGIWLVLLARDEQSTRETAAARLSAILGRSIDFDPAADQQTRQLQIERLRKRLKAAEK